MLIGPLLGDFFLAQRERANFETLFVVAALANVLPAIGLYFLRPSESQGSGSSVRLSEFIAVTCRHWPGMILLVDLAFGVCMSGPFIYLASFIDAAQLRLDGVSVIGVFFVCYAGLGITVRLSSRRLPDRVGARKVLLVGMLFMSAGMSCFGLVEAGRAWMIIVPAVLAGVGHGLMFHTMTSLTLERFPKEVRGTGSALALMMLDLGTIAGAPVLGWIGQEFGFPILFAAIGFICLATAIAYAVSSLPLAIREVRRKVRTLDH
jgi:predicted MFS family arabinose efflux permease